jgi:hypothetical protein
MDHGMDARSVRRPAAPGADGAHPDDALRRIAGEPHPVGAARIHPPAPTPSQEVSVTGSDRFRDRNPHRGAARRARQPEGVFQRLVLTLRVLRR